MARLEVISAHDVMRTVPLVLTVRVTGLRWLEFRLRLVSLICRLSAKILGCEWELRDR